ncbi:hypothetical protein D3C81_564970 [compost metagenome]
MTQTEGNVGAQLPERGDVVACIRQGQVGGRGKNTVVALPLGRGCGQSRQQGLGTFRQLRGVQYGVIDRDAAALGFRLLLGQPAFQTVAIFKGHPGRLPRRQIQQLGDRLVGVAGNDQGTRQFVSQTAVAPERQGLDVNQDLGGGCLRCRVDEIQQHIELFGIQGALGKCQLARRFEMLAIQADGLCLA